MPEWSAPAGVFLAQFNEAHPDFYQRLLASPPFRGNEEILVGTTEAELEKLGPAGVYVAYLAFVAKMYAKDASRIPTNADDSASPLSTITQLKTLAAEMPKMTWHFEDLKALDHARHVLENQIEKLNEKAGFVAPNGPKRAPIDLVEARRLLANGVPLAKVAKRYGVSSGKLEKLIGPKF